MHASEQAILEPDRSRDIRSEVLVAPAGDVNTAANQHIVFDGGETDVAMRADEDVVTDLCRPFGEKGAVTDLAGERAVGKVRALKLRRTARPSRSGIRLAAWDTDSNEGSGPIRRASPRNHKYKRCAVRMAGTWANWLSGRRTNTPTARTLPWRLVASGVPEGRLVGRTTVLVAAPFRHDASSDVKRGPS